MLDEVGTASFTCVALPGSRVDLLRYKRLIRVVECILRIEWNAVRKIDETVGDANVVNSPLSKRRVRGR